MKTLFLTLALGLAATTAAESAPKARAIALDKDYIVCQSLSTVIMIDEQVTEERALYVMKGAVERDLCRIAPAGMRVVVRRRLDAFACIGAADGQHCFWTVYPSKRSASGTRY